MYLSKDYAAVAESAEELPEAFRLVLEDNLGNGERLQFLVYSPAFQIHALRASATVLAVTDEAWFVLTRDEGMPMSVVTSEFEDTLLVELGVLLLHGHLKMDFTRDGEQDSVIVEFNAVMQDLFVRAVELILQGMEAPYAAPLVAEDGTDLLRGWPLKFVNAALNYLPAGSPVLAAVHWPTLQDGFRRELAPAGALLLTARELVVITGEKAPPWAKDWTLAQLGDIVIYVPLGRLTGCHVDPHRKLGVLGLEIGTRGGSEGLDILFAVEKIPEVHQLMERVLDWSPSSPMLAP